MKRRRVIGVALGVTLALVLGLVISAMLTGPEEELQGGVMAVERGTVERLVDATGELRMPQKVELSFRCAATSLEMYTVAEIRVEEGDGAKEGDMLASVDTEPLERDLEEAISKLKVAEAQYQDLLEDYDVEHNYADYIEEAWVEMHSNLLGARAALAKRLLTFINPGLRDAISSANLLYMPCALWNWGVDWYSSLLESERSFFELRYNTEESAEEWRKRLEYARTDKELVEIVEKREELVQKQISLEDVRDRLDKATIYAPFDGIVDLVDVEVGDRVKGEELVILLVNPSEVEVEALVDEVDVFDVKVGQEVHILIDALPEIELKGKVRAVAIAQPPTEETAASALGGGGAGGGVVNYTILIDVEPPRWSSKMALPA